jgi:hypothetical protein
MVKDNEQLEKRLGAVLFIAALFCYSYFFHFHDRWPNPNETTRLYSAISMAEDLDPAINRQIDRYGVIWDRAEYKGRLYSDKAPGLSMLAVPPLMALHKAGKIFGKEPSLAAKHWVARFFCVILPSALFSILLFIYLKRFLKDPYLRAGLIFVYTCGTLAATFSTLFFGHQTSAVFLFAAFVLLDRMRPSGAPLPAPETGSEAVVLDGDGQVTSVAGPDERAKNAWMAAAVAGFLLGWASITEYPAAPAGAVIFLAALITWKRRAPLIAAVLAGLVPVALWLLYNKACFGSPFSLGYSHLDSAEFARVHSKGLLGVTLPSASAFVGTFLGPQRGLLFFSPVCIFGFFGLFSLWRSGGRYYSLVVAAMIALFAYITSSFGYWIGGDVVGPRHLTPLIPFLFVPAAAFLDRAAGSAGRTAMVLFTAASLVSVIMTGASTVPFPFFPTPFVNPFRDLALAFWEKGIFPYNAGRVLGFKGLYSAVPYIFLFLILLITAMFWLTHRPAGKTKAMWRSGVLTRAAPLVCLWFAIVLNAVPSQVSESTYNERIRELSVFDPAGEDLLDLKIDAYEKAGRPAGMEGARLMASGGKTTEALEIYRWMKTGAGR